MSRGLCATVPPQQFTEAGFGAQVVKLEGASIGSAAPTTAQNGMPSATPVKQEESKPEVKQGTPQGTPAQMDAGTYMYATKVSAGL